MMFFQFAVFQKVASIGRLGFADEGNIFASFP